MLLYQEYCEKMMSGDMDAMGFAQVHGIELLVSGSSKCVSPTGRNPLVFP